MVWIRQSRARLGVDNAIELPALRTRRQERLGLLRLVLRTRFCRRDNAYLSGQTLHSSLQQPTLSRLVDAVHALLSLVPHQGAQALEDSWCQTVVQSLSMGSCERFLEFLRLVPGAGAA
jgi:hypothetical protein